MWKRIKRALMPWKYEMSLEELERLNQRPLPPPLLLMIFFLIGLLVSIAYKPSFELIMLLMAGGVAATFSLLKYADMMEKVLNEKRQQSEEQTNMKQKMLTTVLSFRIKTNNNKKLEDRV